MSNLPAARARLTEVVNQLWALHQEVQVIHGMMLRQSPTRRAPVRQRLTRVQALAIRRYARKHPKASMQAIAEAVGISNMGRVSEVLSGKRFPARSK
jgi:hypothetical protein